MDFRHEAEYDLRSLNAKRKAVDNLKEQISILEAEADGMHGISTDAPVKGGMSRAEEKLVNAIDKKMRLEKSLQVTEALVHIVEKTLEQMTDTQKELLDVFFVNPRYLAADYIMEKYHIERPTVYKWRQGAIEQYARIMYGILGW